MCTELISLETLCAERSVQVTIDISGPFLHSSGVRRNKWRHFHAISMYLAFIGKPVLHKPAPDNSLLCVPPKTATLRTGPAGLAANCAASQKVPPGAHRPLCPPLATLLNGTRWNPFTIKLRIEWENGGSVPMTHVLCL